jgi:type IV secretion system protein VirB11
MMNTETSTIDLHLEPLRRFLDDETLTEIVVNEPGIVMTEGRDGWQSYDVPEVSQQWCLGVAKLIANDTNQSIDQVNPMLAGQLPSGERVQIAIPPVVPQGTTSITIRKPSNFVLSLEEIVAGGAFEKTRCEQSLRLSPEERERIEADLPEDDTALLKLFRKRQWFEFFDKAVKRRKNIISSGATGSGKTTLANALVQRIPLEERLITVEDVREMRLPHVNKVHMVYSKDSKGLSKATPKQIFEGNLRQRPDRVLPAELRGDEAFFFIQNVINSGHPGTITSGHANSAKLMFQRLSMMIKASPEGAGLNREDILEMLYSLIDIVLQMERQPDGKRVVKEVYYDPAYARKQMG